MNQDGIALTSNDLHKTTSVTGRMLQRKCACGQHTAGGDECAQCRNDEKLKHPLQTKLQIGAAHDRYEQEADRVADQVMAMSGHSAFSTGGPGIQRLARQTTGLSDTAPASVDRVLASAGRPLQPSLRQDMEQRFGHDFSRIQVHTGAAAAQSAHDVSARAYTTGHNIVFGEGHFAPKTYGGLQLIAHELTHVVQQTGTGGTRIDRNAFIQRQAEQDGEQGISRGDEIALSKRSPGQFEIGSGFPPVMSLFNFGINDHKLKTEHKDNLQILGELFGLMGSSEWQISAIGHADSTGVPSVNDPLSARRADEVRKYLAEVAKGNYFIQGEGENRPVTTNESVSGRTRNRRVDIIFNNPGIDITIPDPKPDPQTVCQLFPSLCDEKEFCDRYPDLCGKGFCAKYPAWCLLPVLCLMFPPACACLKNPILCACGMRPALCACLANPLACLNRPEKEDEPEPKRKRACPLHVDLPSGVFEAKKLETVGFAFLSFPFDMKIDFDHDSSGCECACGEYSQLVRGYFREFVEDEVGTGIWRTIDHTLPRGNKLSESDFHEDGPLGWGPYGYRNRADGRNIKEDQFRPTRASGCKYRGEDEPQIRTTEGTTKIEMYLQFKGGPVELCESPGKRLALDSHWKSWIIHGEAQVKGPPPQPPPLPIPRRPPDGKSGPDPYEVTTPEETDIVKGAARPAWYAGGIPSDATSGRYRMKLRFEADGKTKYSHVGVRIEESNSDSISVITLNKKNLNLNPGRDKTAVIVSPNSRETIMRRVLQHVE